MANETTTAAQPSFLDSLGGWVTSAGKIFNGLTDVYVAADQRVKALESINEDTKAAPKTTVPTVVSGAVGSLPSWVLPAAIAAGVVVLIIVVKKLR